jgi:hypothetical protein
MMAFASSSMNKLDTPACFRPASKERSNIKLNDGSMADNKSATFEKEYPSSWKL